MAITRSSQPFDFWQWLEHYKEQYPNARFSIEDAIDSYNKTYFCTCISCVYRKEKGFWPMKINPNCQLPMFIADIHPTHVLFMP